MMHLLAVELVMDIAARMEQLGREHMVLGLGFLQAKYVGLLFIEQPFDDLRSGADRIDIPGSDFELGHVKFCSALSGRVKKGQQKEGRRKGGPFSRLPPAGN